MSSLARSAFSLLRRRRAFARLWFAGVITQLGDWVGWVAISVFTLRAGGGGMDLAAVYAAHSLPTLVTLPLAGAVLDRLNARTTLVCAAATMGVLTVGMVAAAEAQHLLVLQALLVARSMVEAAVRPAERSALVRLVDEDELLLANAFEGSSWSVVFSLGMVVGGLITGLGTTTALTLDALSFFFAAAMFARLPALPATQEERQRHHGQDGRRAKSSAALRFATYAKTPLALAAGAGWMVIALRVDAWVGASAAFGWIHGARGLGAGLGSMTAGWRGHNARAWPALVAVGFGGFALLAATTSAWATALAALAWGVGSGANWVFSGEAQQRLASPGSHARVAARDTWAWTLAMCLGALAVGWAHDRGHTAQATLALLASAGAVTWAVAWADACMARVDAPPAQNTDTAESATTPAATALPENTSTAARATSRKPAENTST